MNRGQGARLDRVEQELATVSGELQRITEILQLIYDNEPLNRRMLYELRESAGYEQAFSVSGPLVSVPIPTYTRHDTLVERAIASVLAQTYQNFEIVVVGDAAPPETAERIAAVGDERISYHNRPIRGPYPESARDTWHVVGTSPWNEAIQRSRGLWIAPLNDDDAFTPNHIEMLLEHAQKGRHEVAYGKIAMHLADGSTEILGRFPPGMHQFGLQAATYHAGLRFMELELADALFNSPGDWSLCRRMLRAGVRFGMVDEVVVDYYPARSWDSSEIERPG